MTTAHSSQTPTPTSMQTKNQTLWELRSKESAVIIDFNEQLDSRYQERVLELGFRPKVKVTCLKASSFGAPKVYQVNNSVFSIEQSIAAHINVILSN